jgi:hypothetical protein
VIGTIARGLVFALAGVLVIDAAITHKASESGGIDKALLTLRDQPFGELLMTLAALGLVVFRCVRAMRGPLAENLNIPGTAEARTRARQQTSTERKAWHG